MDPELLMQLLSDPANADVLAQMGIYPEQMAALEHQRGLGEHMLATPGAQGREAGRTYVASSPLEHLGVAVQRGLGAKRLADVTDKEGALTQGQAGANQTLAKILADTFRQRRQQQAEPVQAPEDFQAGNGPGPWAGGYR